MKMLRNTLFAWCAIATIGVAFAQDYPKKPVTLVVAYAASGAIDIVLRMIQPRLTASLGQPLVMLNRPGGGGTIAATAAIGASNDGYTLLVTGDQLVITPHLMAETSRYDVFRDLVPITRLITVPFALVVNPSISAGNVNEFISLARKRPGKITYATPGNGTSNHLSMEWLKSLAGFDVLHVPYKGAAASITDVSAGRVDSILISVQMSAPLVKTGKLRALAVTSSTRSPLLPAVPTFAESGLAEFDAATTFGLFAPAGTPAAIIQRLHADFAAALNTAEIRKQIEEMGTVVTADTPAEFGKKVRADYERYGRIIRDQRIQAE